MDDSFEPIGCFVPLLALLLETRWFRPEPSIVAIVEAIF